MSVDIFCGEIMVYLSVLLLFFQKLRPFNYASRTNIEIGSVMLRDSRVNLVRVAAANLVSNPDSDIRLQLEWGHYWCFGFADVSWVLVNIFIESWDCCQNNAREMQDTDFVELSVHNFLWRDYGILVHTTFVFSKAPAFDFCFYHQHWVWFEFCL
jgi:hypothetical protein